ncbi:MAG TPA: hypothetical protein VIY48_18890 [Candidatus Paceibacterota bacterium]
MSAEKSKYHIHAELQYVNYRGENVHSDLCWVGERSRNGGKDWEEYCQFLHDNLTEWLENFDDEDFEEDEPSDGRMDQGFILGRAKFLSD